MRRFQTVNEQNIRNNPKKAAIILSKFFIVVRKGSRFFGFLQLSVMV